MNNTIPSGCNLRPRGMTKRSAAMRSATAPLTTVWHRLPTGAYITRAILALAVFAQTGCSMMSNPFRDDLVNAPPATTPSADGVRSAKVSRVAPQRRFQVAEAVPEDCAVTHAPLFFEDPSEVIGSDDGKFAWTGEDYWSFLAWRGRFLVNIVLFPVNFLETPMWTLMTSDGEGAPRGPFGEFHDAARAESTSPTVSARPAHSGNETDAAASSPTG